jgi:hypothetical protein
MTADHVVICEATGLPLLDTHGNAKWYTEEQALKVAMMVEASMKNAGHDVKYTVRRLPP